MKIYADVKPRRKVSIQEFVNHQMQKVCSCDILEQKGKNQNDQKLLHTAIPKIFVGIEFRCFS